MPVVNVNDIILKEEAKEMEEILKSNVKASKLNIIKHYKSFWRYTNHHKKRENL